MKRGRITLGVIMTEELFALVLLAADDEPLFVGHTHNKKSKAAYRGTTTKRSTGHVTSPADDEDNNNGDRAFTRIEAYL